MKNQIKNPKNVVPFYYNEKKKYFIKFAYILHVSVVILRICMFSKQVRMKQINEQT